MSSRVSTENEAVPVQPIVVALLMVLVPVLLAAFILLYLSPSDLGAARFAWSIKPRMTSMMLGATYLGGAYFFVCIIRSRKWRHAWLGLLPVTAFAGTLGIATILHWDIFPRERLGFQLWAFLYFLIPIVLPILWDYNQRLTVGIDLKREGELPLVSCRGFGGLGVLLTLAGVLLFIFPQQMLGLWPWTLTPLTARTMAAMFVLPGLVGMSIAYDGSWSSARYLLQAQAVSIILILVAVYVARADFNWARPVSWVFAVGLGLILLLIVYTYAKRESEGA